MLNIIGCESSIGSMLIPSKQRGHNILAMADTRPFTHYGTVENYFKLKHERGLNSLLVYKDKADIVFSQPSCAKYSQLQTLKQEVFCKGALKPQDNSLPLNVFETIKALNPRFFVIENVRGILKTPIQQILPEILNTYKISFNVLIGQTYGNLQRRARVFIIGSKDKDFEFKPISHPITPPTLGEVIKDCDGIPNHPETYTDKFFDRMNKVRVDYDGFRKIVRDNWLSRGYNQKLLYRRANGVLDECVFYPGMCIPLNQRKIRCITTMSRYYVFDKGEENLPRELSVRECARIMGFPDDFVFYGKSPAIRFKQVVSSVVFQISDYITQQIENYIKEH